MLQRALLVTAGLHASLVTIAMYPPALDAFELPKSIVAYSFAAGESVLLAGALLIFGRRIWPRSIIHWPVFALVAWYSIGTAFAQNHYVALFGERLRHLGLLSVLAGLSLYASLAVAARRPRDASTFLLVAGLAVPVVLGYEVLQLIGADPLPWSTSATRGFSTVGNANSLGHYLVVAAVSVASVGLVSSHLPVRLRAPLIAIAILCLAGALASATRGVVLGLLGATAGAGAIWGRYLTRLWRPGILLGGLVAVALVSGLVYLSPVRERLVLTASAIALRDRLLIYEGAVRVIASSPLFGVGPDNFAVVYPRVRQPESLLVPGLGRNTIQTSPHNWLLQFGVGAGMPALLLAAAALASGLWLALAASPSEPRGRITKALGVGLAAFAGHAMVSVGAHAIEWMWWGALGCIAGLSGDRGESQPHSREIRHQRSVVVLAGALLLLLLAVGVWGALRASSSALLALNMRGTDPHQAMAAATAAVRLDGGRARHWNALGLALEAAGDLGGAALAYREAAARAPYIPNHWWNYIHVRLAAARHEPNAADDAVHAALQSVQIDPQNPDSQHQLALAALAAGDYELARNAARRAHDLFPSAPEFIETSIEVANRTGSIEDLRHWLLKLVIVRDTVPPRLQLALIAYDNGVLDEAKFHVDRALALDAGNALASALARRLRGEGELLDWKSDRIELKGAQFDGEGVVARTDAEAAIEVTLPAQVITFRFTKGPDFGKVELLLDETSRLLVDQRNQERQPSQRTVLLPPGRHTVVLRLVDARISLSGFLVGP